MRHRPTLSLGDGLEEFWRNLDTALPPYTAAADGSGGERTTMYRFDGYELDLQRQELRRGEDIIPVEPQVFAVLAWLVAHHDRVVGKEELLDEVWHTRFVTESTLTSRIKDARRA